jgi:hypothetical protein
MTMIIDGTNGLTFNNATTQASAGLTSSSTQVCQAWVNFNGTVTTPSTIRASYNVSSITRNGTGDYTINFTNALTDANYAATCSSRQLTASGYLSVATDVNTSGTALTRTTTTYQIQCQNVVGGLNDNPYMQVIILR